MSGLGGLNKSPRGVVLGVVQLQLPVVKTTQDLAAQTQKICDMVAKARRNMGSMDLVVFPEYSLHGLSMDTNPEIMCRLDGPEVAAFKRACAENKIWGCFSIMEFNPRWQSIQQRDHPRRPRCAETLLPQAPSVGPSGALGAWQPRHSRVRRA